ncbi:MAG: hypothetical protein ACI9FR_001566 [Cryomorphaceae bacterium]|jgi:hypothetical protein
MNRLKEIAAQIDQQSSPPVHLWKPDDVGEIDMRIDAQGFWFHEGGPILREKLVKLFASILWFEDGQHYLVTPVEKLVIEVEDCAFVVHQMEHVEDTWVAVTNTHEQVIVSQQNPVELRLYQDQWVPYVNVRYDLWARVNRSIYYQWVSEAMQQQASEDARLSLHSGGYWFEVAR